jgi:hypothetical protein
MHRKENNMMNQEEIKALEDVCEYLIHTEHSNSAMFMNANILNNYLIGLISTGVYPK